jgi:hypothetical protein
VRSTQAPAQATDGGVHSAAQTPSLQTGVPAPQRTPHPPQFSGSVASSTHAFEQNDDPGAHAHLPPRHPAPAAHVAPHAPQ